MNKILRLPFRFCYERRSEKTGDTKKKTCWERSTFYSNFIRKRPWYIATFLPILLVWAAWFPCMESFRLWNLYLDRYTLVACMFVGWFFSSLPSPLPPLIPLHSQRPGQLPFPGDGRAVLPSDDAPLWDSAADGARLCAAFAGRGPLRIRLRYYLSEGPSRKERHPFRLLWWCLWYVIMMRINRQQCL